MLCPFETLWEDDIPPLVERVTPRGNYQAFGDTELVDGVLFSTVFRVYFSEKVPSRGSRAGASPEQMGSCESQKGANE